MARGTLFIVLVAFVFALVSAQNCPDAPCQNGVCLPTGLACNCTTGWAGAVCEVAICDPNCFAGKCVRPNVCDCTGTGYKGPICDEITCEKPCQNGGVCTKPNFCDCTGTGWESDACQIAICNPGCQNGGKCTSPDTCDCTGTGWEGDICEIPICDEIECANNGTCSGHNVCDCRGTGFIGVNCSIDIVECDQKIPLCVTGIKCVNTPGSYECPCPKGFSGNNKIGGPGCSPICTGGCFQNTTCIAPEQCNCNGTGYTGAYCQTDIDECAASQNGKFCSMVANCTNTPGSYICGECPRSPFPGYYGSADTGRGGSGCTAICNPPCADGLYCSAPPNVCSEIPKEASSSMRLALSIVLVMVICMLM